MKVQNILPGESRWELVEKGRSYISEWIPEMLFQWHPTKQGDWPQLLLWKKQKEF